MHRHVFITACIGTLVGLSLIVFGGWHIFNAPLQREFLEFQEWHRNVNPPPPPPPLGGGCLEPIKALQATEKALAMCRFDGIDNDYRSSRLLGFFLFLSGVLMAGGFGFIAIAVKSPRRAGP